MTLELGETQLSALDHVDQLPDRDVNLGHMLSLPEEGRTPHYGFSMSPQLPVMASG